MLTDRIWYEWKAAPAFIRHMAANPVTVCETGADGLSRRAISQS